ncbi:MAG: hypothetical protein Q9162_001103 [Coniocarpon cinnabarinum]
MLQEVLLALSGHASPIFEDTTSFPHITPPESALLQSLGHLAALHRALKTHAARIAAEHPSNICRAIANAVRSRHLNRFQATILEVERRILSNDPGLVAAHKTVPLASLVGDFTVWHRPLEWLWDTLCFMLPVDYKAGTANPKLVGSGPATINRLRSERLTGFAEIEELATVLLSTGESAWLKQLTIFFMSNERSSSDFCIHKTSSRHGSRLRVSKRNLPGFMSMSTAQSVLHVGKAYRYLEQAEKHSNGDEFRSSGLSAPMNTDRLVAVNTLASLQLPINADKFDAAISEVRASLSSQLSTAILPSAKIVEIIEKLNHFLLLQRVDFTDALIMEADSHLRIRHTQLQDGVSRGFRGDLAGITLREGELNSIMSRALAATFGGAGTYASVDTDLDWAGENIKFDLVKPSEPEDDEDDEHLDVAKANNSSSNSSNFNDFIMPAATHLTIQLQPPLDLVLSASDIETYTTMNSYLLSIRRAHLHMTWMWRQAHFRKGAAFVANSNSNYKYRMLASEKLRKRFDKRVKAMRAIWTTCTQCVHLLLELGEYLISHVGYRSWDTFRHWVQGRPPAHRTGSSAEEMNEVPSEQTADSNPVLSASEQHHIQTQHDPETISQGHRHYLATLYAEFLLDQPSYKAALRTLLQRVDQLVALVQRLQTVQGRLDLADEGVDDGFSEKYAQEEHDVVAELNNASERLNAAMKTLTTALGEVDTKAKTAPIYAADRPVDFEPWRGGSVDRVLMRLDFHIGSQMPSE